MALLAAQAFASSTTAGYTVQTSATSGPVSSGTDSIVSQPIDTSLRPIENKKIVTGIVVVVAFADVAAYLGYQISHDGTNWSPSSTISTDVATGTTLNVTGTYVHQWDLSDVYAPYIRLVFNQAENAVTVDTSGTMKFFFAYK
tara:strand:- start:231 stop:659 length:429 start_codon:yes stop_codon:yes gene_type:complete